MHPGCLSLYGARTAVHVAGRWGPPLGPCYRHNLASHCAHGSFWAGCLLYLRGFPRGACAPLCSCRAWMSLFSTLECYSELVPWLVRGSSLCLVLLVAGACRFAAEVYRVSARATIACAVAAAPASVAPAWIWLFVCLAGCFLRGLCRLVFGTGIIAAACTVNCCAMWSVQ
jgi:hypothetical protein